MIRKFIKPNFKKSNLNISATLAEFLDCPNRNHTIKILKKALANNYKNVVFMCFDGLGINPLNINLPKDSFLRKHIVEKLVSTFPSTTTNATTSLMTNTLPLEHGWFGWSVYFESLNRNINIFLDNDSWTNEKIEIKESPLSDVNFYFDEAKSDYMINTVFPAYVKVKHPENNNVFHKTEEFFDIIESICEKEGKQFIYAYCGEPDSTMHSNGVTSNEAKEVIEFINDNVEKLSKQVKDTLFIITADHGQIDVEGYIELYKDKEIMDMLKIYPYIEPRAVAFMVKEEMKEKFVKTFNKKYKKDFKLYRTEYLIKKGYFGDYGDKVHLLGNFIAIGTYTHKLMLLNPNSNYFKGHHTSLTEEMKVPLILIENR